jgi:VanZ like protein
LGFRNTVDTRRRPQDAAERTVRRAGSLVVACALVVIAAITLSPSPVGDSLAFFCIFCGSTGSVDFVLNVLLFVPLGVGLRLLRGNSARTAFIGFLVTLAIEALQWRIIPGRDAAFGDIVANVGGAWLGAVLTVAALPLWRARGAYAMRLSVWCGAVVTVIVTVVAFMLLPGSNRAVHQVQWMAARANQDKFSGALHSASLNSRLLRPVTAVRSDVFNDTIDLRAAISGGDSVSRRVAEILRIASFGGEGLLLAQRGTALLFRASTHASRFRFRSLLVALPGQFASSPQAGPDPPETVIEGRNGPSFISLVAVRGTTRDSVALRRSVGLGWTLLLPWNIGIGPDWWPANVLWLGVLLFPASFFTARAAERGPQIGNARAKWWPLVMVGGALVIVPAAMGLSPLSALEWTGVAIGIIGGIGVARAAVRGGATP